MKRSATDQERKQPSAARAASSASASGAGAGGREGRSPSDIRGGRGGKSRNPAAASRGVVASVARSPVVRRVIGHTAGAALLVAGVGAAFHYCKRYVDARLTADAATANNSGVGDSAADGSTVGASGPKVVLIDRPGWMSDALAKQIVAALPNAAKRSPFDRGLLEQDAAALAADPWVKSVRQVRRCFGQQPGDRIEVRCDFRTPVALASWDGAYWYVDGDGVKLPEQFDAGEVTRLVDLAPGSTWIIDGIQQRPARVGNLWPGDDLQAALALRALLAAEPYADQIASIDVSNFAGRAPGKGPNAAQITLRTRWGTEVRWGQPISAKAWFVEAKVDQKLSHLADALARTGRIDMNQPWIDVRFDNIVIPSGPTGVATTTDR